MAYVFLKRRPVVCEMSSPDQAKSFSLPGFLAHARKAFRGKRPLLVLNSTNLVFPVLSRVLRATIGGLWCFDMHDDLLYNRTGLRRRRMELGQRLLLGGADLVVHAAPSLKELFPRSLHLGNASNQTPIKRAEPNFCKVLILASLDRRIDFDILSRAAELNPDLTFEIFGQISENDPAVAADLADLQRSRPNVLYRGAYVNRDLPSILGAFRVTFAPYATGSQLTRYIDPLRFYHCLNSGLEVVSTDIPKARDLSASLHLVGSAEEVGPLVRRLRDDPAARRNAKPDASADNWRARAVRLMEIVTASTETRSMGAKT
ncbi:hypothetical protein ASG54_23185 [Aureimonas sp. Leaf460]|nr:hypothetical protein ASG62_23915 [Aureimonas sp. Leaf427]KQT62216.1 hypothetical protein ASG54_23185 [Aureimonas sp. Leaf460]